MGHQVEGGDLFLFFNRRRDRLKVLWFTGDGLLILYKKLEVGTFESLRAPEASSAACSSHAESESTSAPCLSLGGRELALLLEGIELASVKRRRWWRQE